ncbi:MAG: hypothetical protein HY701_00665, partial [Gemmatimonadetes bacterium]|nr:hypothetical protein [Gemmatimonadota bacterium]
FDMSLGAGLGRLADSVFRVGHLGAFNDLMLAGTLAGLEMGLRLAGVPHRDGGVQAALAELVAESPLHGRQSSVDAPSSVNQSQPAVSTTD